MARAVKERTGYREVEAGFLELSEPSIPEAIKNCLAREPEALLIIPYLSHYGTHLQYDAPQIIKASQQGHPESKIYFGRHLGVGTRLAELIVDRAKEAETTFRSHSEAGKMPMGIVYLVGAGPGDPELITIKGYRAIRRADVIIYDRLVSPSLLGLAKKSCRKIYAGKYPGGSRRQAYINEIMIEEASKGRIVVRLKNGDPLIFGRGGEEAEALKERGIPFQIIPGISSVNAAAAYGGIPLTRRKLSSSVAIVTGSESEDKLQRTVNLKKIAEAVDTIVILMGIARLETIVKELVEGGLSPQSDTAVVECASLPHQKTTLTKLAELPELANGGRIKPPAVIIVGKVASLGSKLGWFKEPIVYTADVLTRVA